MLTEKDWSMIFKVHGITTEAVEKIHESHADAKLGVHKPLRVICEK